MDVVICDGLSLASDAFDVRARLCDPVRLKVYPEKMIIRRHSPENFGLYLVLCFSAELFPCTVMFRFAGKSVVPDMSFLCGSLDENIPFRKLRHKTPPNTSKRLTICKQEDVQALSQKKDGKPMTYRRVRIK